MTDQDSHFACAERETQFTEGDWNPILPDCDEEWLESWQSATVATYSEALSLAHEERLLLLEALFTRLPAA